MALPVSSSTRLARTRDVQYNILAEDNFSMPPGWLHGCLRNCRVDEVSGLTLGAGSVALRYILPVVDLENNVPPDSSHLQPKLASFSPADEIVHISGSSIEKLSVPPFTLREAPEDVVPQRLELINGPHFTTADVDFMVELTGLPVATQKGAGPLYLEESTASHIGYTRVRWSSDVDGFCTVSEKCLQLHSHAEIDSENGGQYLTASVVKQMFEGPRDEGVKKTLQGPAINLQKLQKKTSPVAHTDVLDMDFVPALPLLGEFSVMSEWLARVSEKHVSWPSKDVRDSIHQHGQCFVVGVGHVTSRERDLEWRFSFSDPEKRLAMCLTPIQRKVYKLIKLLQKCFLKEPKVLVTYHLKTLMFWELEQGTRFEWREEDIFQRLLGLLDRIEQCLQQHCIPSYFMPRNNLISHVSISNVNSVLSKLRQIRRRPLHHIYEIDERLLFDFSSLQPLSQIHQPLREAILRSDIEAIPEALALSLLRQVQSDIKRGRSLAPRCVQLLHDAWQSMALDFKAPTSHPIHTSWVMFAAAAVFSSMEADEGVLILDQLVEQVAVWFEAETKTMQREVGDLQYDLVTFNQKGGSLSLKQEFERAKSNALVLFERKQILEKQEKLKEQHLREVKVLRLRHSQLSMMKLMLNNGELSSDTESFSLIITLAKLNLKFIKQLEQTMIDQEVHLLDVKLAVAKELVRLGEGIHLRETDTQNQETIVNMMTSMTWDTLHHLESVEQDPDGRIVRGRRLLVEETVKKSCACLRDARYEQLDVGLAVEIALDMVDTYSTINAEEMFSKEKMNYRYTPFFNMVGFFLKHKLYHCAVKMSRHLTLANTSVLPMELTQVVHDLRASPTYLENIPGCVLRLLKLTSCSALIGAIHLFISSVNMFVSTLSPRLTRSIPVSGSLRDFAAMTKLPTEVMFTHQVMFVIALQIEKQDTGEGLEMIHGTVGRRRAHRVKILLQQWNDCESMECEDLKTAGKDSKGPTSYTNSIRAKVCTVQ